LNKYCPIIDTMTANFILITSITIVSITIVSITIGFIILFAIKKGLKINKLSKIEREKEITKTNSRLVNSMQIKDILEIVSSFTK
jgi:hypothetical protein